MKKILLLSTPILSLPLVVISCNSVKKNYETKIINIRGGDRTIINIDNYTLSSLENIEVTNKKTGYIEEIDYDKSKVSNNKTKIVLKEPKKEIEEYEIKDKTKENVKFTISTKKTISNYDYNQDKQYFFDLIKDMGTNNIPTIIESRGASLVMEQSFYISLINYYMNKDKNNTNDYSILIPQHDAWKQNRFNTEVLIEKGIWNGIKNIDNLPPENNKNVFNLIENSELYSSADIYINNLNKILSKFKISDKKFDFVIPNVDFANWINEFIKNNDFNKISYILRYANKIVVTSDGAIHTNTVIPTLEKILKNFEPRPREEVIQILEDYQNFKINKLTIRDICDFIVLKNYETINSNSKFNFINIVNYDSNTTNGVDISDKKLWNETTFSTNFVEYANLIEKQEYKNDFIDTYKKVFFGSKIEMQNIFYNGYNSWDPNKRNAIFLGSALFTNLEGEMSSNNFSRLQKFPNTLEKVQETMSELLERFPTDKYNIIFKLHPIFGQEVEGSKENIEIAKNYINLITNNKFSDPIILNTKIPLETLIANDYYEYMHPDSNTNLENIFFRENQTYKAHEWTTFFGLQATTTTIHTTRLFYQSAFNLTKEEVANLIPFSNFPIPKYFPVVARIKNDKIRDHFDDNVYRIRHIYSYYCPSIMFNDEGLKDFDSIILNF